MRIFKKEKEQMKELSLELDELKEEVQKAKMPLRALSIPSASIISIIW